MQTRYSAFQSIGSAPQLLPSHEDKTRQQSEKAGTRDPLTLQISRHAAWDVRFIWCLVRIEWLRRGWMVGFLSLDDVLKKMIFWME